MIHASQRSPAEWWEQPPILVTGTQESAEGRETRMTEAEGGLLHTGGEEGAA